MKDLNLADIGSNIMDRVIAKLRAVDGLRALPVVLAVFFLGFSVVYLSHGPRLSDPDAWHYYRVVKWILEDGKVPEIDLYQYYPTGGNPNSDNIVHSFIIAYSYKIFKLFDVELMEYLMIFPAISHAFSVVFLYLAVNELFGKKSAIFAAVFYAISALALSRVYSGTIDKEVVYGLFVYPVIYFFLKSYKNSNGPKFLPYSMLSGIFFGLAFASWSGGGYIALVLALSVAIYLLFNFDVNLIKVLFLMSITGSLVMHLIQPNKFPITYLMNVGQTLIPIAFSSALLISIFISETLKTKYKKEVHFLKVLLVIGILLSGGTALMGEISIFTKITSTATAFFTLEKGAQENLYMATVAESQPSRFFGGGETLLQRVLSGDFFRELNFALFVLPVGLFLLLRRFWAQKDFPSIFASVWILSGAIAATQGLRLLFFLAPSAATVTGFTFSALYDKIKIKEKELEQILRSSSKKRIIQQAESRLTNIKMAHLLLLLIVFSTTFASLNASVAGRGGLQSDLPKPWYDALIWTKENTPENSVIFFWWDYGYYFQAVANRYTVADGGGNVLRNTNLANMFASPEEEAIKYIKKYVDYEKIPTYILVSYEEFGKSGAINRIAIGDPETAAVRYEADGRMMDGKLYIGSFQVPRTGNFAEDEKAIGNALARNRISTYYIVNAGDSYIIWALIQFDQNGNYHPEWSDKLLPKLLPFNTGYGQGLKHFELVYQDQWNYILIYRVK